jgi:hypothetical protein
VLERAGKPKIFRIVRAAVRGVKDERQLCGLRIAPPQNTGNLEAHPI